MELLKRILRIVFDRTPDDRIDLFVLFPRVKKFFRERRLHAVLRTLGDMIFLFIIFSGLFGPQNPAENSALFLAWGCWWSMVVLSWFFLGRIWCGFCPFPGIGRVLQSLGFTFNLPLPDFIKKKGLIISVVLLAAIIWLEESTGMKESPRGTALLLLSILLGATISAILFPKQAWCRYLCPMGRMIGVASTMAITEFRPNHEKCRECKTFACRRGTNSMGGCPVYLGAFNVRNNLYCLVCGHCLKLCDRDSPQLNLRSPFVELYTNKGRFVTCTFIIPFLIGSQLARFIQEERFNMDFACQGIVVCKMGMFSLLLALGFLFAFLVMRLGSKIFAVQEDEIFGKFSPFIPALIPIAFVGELIYRLNYLIVNAGDFLPVIGRQFSADFLLEYSFNVPHWFFPWMDAIVMTSGFFASIYVLHRMVYGDLEGMISRSRYILSSVIVFFVYLIYLLVIPWGIGGNA